MYIIFVLHCKECILSIFNLYENNQIGPLLFAYRDQRQEDTDPGSYTVEAHLKLINIDYILFTHEHQDHYHIESLKVILENNPEAVVYAND